MGGSRIALRPELLVTTQPQHIESLSRPRGTCSRVSRPALDSSVSMAVCEAQPGRSQTWVRADAIWSQVKLDQLLGPQQGSSLPPLVLSVGLNGAPQVVVDLPSLPLPPKQPAPHQHNAAPGLKLSDLLQG